MKIVKTILAQMSGISQPQQKFILGLFSTIFVVYGKVNFTNLSRYSDLSEKTYRRQFGKQFPFQELNQSLIQQALPTQAEKIAVVDCSFIAKSGKHTYGKDYFFNGCAGRPEKGLEISVIAIVDVEAQIGYALTALQTPARPQPVSAAIASKTPPEITPKPVTKSAKSSRGKKIVKPHKGAQQRKNKLQQDIEATRTDFYLEQIATSKPYFPSQVKYLVADGNYAKEKFVTGVVNLNLQAVGKLRIDANLRYLYTGEQKSRGAKRKYDGKVQLSDLSRLTFVKEIEDKVELYTAVVNHVSLKRELRIVYLVDRRQE